MHLVVVVGAVTIVYGQLQKELKGHVFYSTILE